MTRQKPRERLEKTLARVAREQGLDQERLRRWVSFLALSGALDQAIQTGILAGYYHKGGVAMELRFAQNARATKDLDVGMEGARADRLRSLTEALAAGFDDFTFRIKAQTRDMEQADTIRVQVAIQYRTRAWQTSKSISGLRMPVHSRAPGLPANASGDMKCSNTFPKHHRA